MKFIDNVIEKGIIFLLIFTPFAFGAVQTWSTAVLEITALSIFFLHLFGKAGDVTQFRQKLELRHQILTASCILFISLVIFILFQTLPLPPSVLQAISPASFETYRNFGDYPSGAYHPVSLNPYATRQALFLFLSYAAVFFIIISHYRTKVQVASIVKTILYMGFFLVIFAVIQKMTWNGRVYWIYPVNEALKSGSGIWGPYINRDDFAGYMEMAVPLGMGMLIYSSPHLRTFAEAPLQIKIARFWSSDKIIPFTLLFLLVLIMTAALFMTFSRGGIIGFSISAIFFARITHRRKTLRKKTAMLAVLAAVVLAAVVLASWDRLEKRFADLEQDHISRRDVWHDSLGIVKDYPAVGAGLGTFANVYMRYQTTMPRTFFDHAHNDYIELLTDIGMVGFLLAAAMALYFFAPLFRRWKEKRSMFGKCIGAGGLSSCTAIAAHSFTDFNLHIPANALLFTVTAAVTYAAIFNVTPNSSDYTDTCGSESCAPSPQNAAVTGRAAFLTLLLALLTLSSPIRELAADYFFRQVPGLLDDKKTAGRDTARISESSMPAYLAAIDSLKKAAAPAPNSLCEKTLSDIYNRLGSWSGTMHSLNAPIPPGAPSKKEASGKALLHIKKAISLEPTNPDYHLTLGKLYDAGAEAGLAEKELARAAAAYPVNAPLRYSLAMHCLLTGRTGDALKHARILAKIDDSYILRESPQKKHIMERQPPGYLSQLSGSYLYSALEIAWRVSQDVRVIKGIAPYTPEASQVVQLFIDSRGLESTESPRSKKLSKSKTNP